MDGIGTERGWYKTYQKVRLEADGLKAEIEQLRAWNKELLKQLGITADLLHEVEASEEQLLADKERLDWLAEPGNEFAFPVRDPSTGEWFIYHSDDEFDVSAPTLREAIDKAGKVVVEGEGQRWA